MYVLNIKDKQISCNLELIFFNITFKKVGSKVILSRLRKLMLQIEPNV